MKKLKQKFVNWLLKEQIEKINQLEVSNDYYREMIKTHERFLKLQKEQFKQLQEARQQLENTVGNIGVAADVSINKYDPSWAVVCIQGQQQDFIKFVNLDHKHARDIKDFLHHFDRKNVTADLPHGMYTDKFLRF